MREIHLKAPRGWINDPNGFIYFGGEYHLFYQHFPYAPRWGRMHWGHAVSDDLMNWEHKEIALFPTKTADCDGCFSGSTIEAGGRLHLFYTGVNYCAPNPENTNVCNGKFIASQLHISSENGYTFNNFEDKSVIIPPIEDVTIGDINDTRDPKVWLGNDGNYYLILGSTAEHKGRFLFYRSKDLEHWEYVNFVTKSDLGWMWECPDYFETGGKGIVIFSPMGLPNGSQAICGFADFNEESCTMTIGNDFQLFDIGLDLYAPQSTVDKDGRRAVVAWLRMPEPMKNGAIGMFSMPRVCHVRNGHIYFCPHPEIRSKFNKKTNSAKGIYMLKATLSQGDCLNIGGYKIQCDNQKIITDRSNVIRGHSELKNVFETPSVGENIQLEIYVDENIIEIFANDGEYVITNTVYDLKDEISGTVKTEVYVTKD